MNESPSMGSAAPEVVQRCLGEARLAREQGDWEVALKAARKAVCLAPGTLEPLLECASILRECGRLDDAELQYREALRVAPQNIDTLLGLAMVAALAGDLEAAIVRYREAAAAEPDNLAVHEALRNALIAQRCFDWKADVVKALEILQRNSAKPQDRLAACRLLLQYGVTQGLEGELKAQSAHSRLAADLLREVRQLERSGLARPLPSGGAARELDEDELVLSFGVTEKPVAGSDTLVVVFGGANHRLGLSFDIIQRVLRSSGVSTLYLRDLERTWYLGGIVGLGKSFHESADGLRATALRLEATRILVLANCVGCAAAVRYGLEVGAEAILGFAPRIRIPEGASGGDLPRDRLSELCDAQPFLAKDVRELYRSADHAPRLTLVYAEHHAEDSAEALHMAGLQGSEVICIADHAGHACLNLILGSGVLTRLLHEFVRDGTVSAEVRVLIQCAAHPRPGAPGERGRA